jgi:hypothetical protein
MDGRPGLRSGDEAEEDTDIESANIKPIWMWYLS